MGFYLRKSISVGPLRFNLSKSGIGVSAGVKGLRIGTGPRGNYVHMGRSGLYYRATLPPLSSPTQPSSSRIQPAQPVALQPASQTHAPLEEIESADIHKIVDSSSRELLKELNEKQNATRLTPIVAWISGISLVIGLISGWPGWLLGLMVLAAGGGIYAAHNRDVLAKTVVLFYDFDSEMETAYGQLHSCAARLASSSAIWHIEASGKVHDRKYHAGASSLVQRKPTSIRRIEPPFVKTNIETFAIGVGRQTLHFFPDRVLVYDTNGVGAVSYEELNITVSAKRFIESDAVPRDAKVVDHTWQYVNKSGGPDRRFKGNKELPVCLYEEVALTSRSGLNELLQISQLGVSESFASVIALLGRVLPQEKNSSLFI